jgi:branched-chain amino acid transport system ATP-binding protein
VLELREVSVSYGRVEALKSVSLHVSEGSIFAVLGANGAGKTTLLRAILGLNRANGSIRVHGDEISTLATFKRARLGIALVPEGRRLFSDFTIEENLRMGMVHNADRSSSQQDLEEVFQSFPVLKERLKHRARTLSGGEGQMLAIARALLSKPKLLLLDEPSVGLMPRAVAETFDSIAAYSKRKRLTVLLVEQNARKALGIADEAAVLELGRLTLQGDAAMLKTDDRIKKAYLGG